MKLFNTQIFIFSFCFEKHVVPSLCLKSVVRPIPKSSDKNPYVPLNYSGISLISCIGKFYSNILDNRLISCLDENNILVDEQNLFRKSRSCVDHIFTLSSIIKDKKMKNTSVFAAFIDMSKAFNCFNRSLLLYKLLKKNINGNLYLPFSALYDETLSWCKLTISELTGLLLTKWSDRVTIYLQHFSTFISMI